MTAAIVALFGIFNIVGGVIGYVKVKSVPSLVAGIVSGAVLLLVCAPAILGGSESAAIIAAVIAFLLGGRFLITWFKKKKVMPDLIIVILSGLTLLAIGISLLK